MVDTIFLRAWFGTRKTICFLFAELSACLELIWPAMFISFKREISILLHFASLAFVFLKYLHAFELTIAYTEVCVWKTR